MEMIKNDESMFFNYKKRPSWILCILLGLQHFLTMCLPNAVASLIVMKRLCLKDDAAIKSEIISASFFVMSINTILQTTIGSRLPIVQGATYSLLIPTLSFLSMDDVKECDVNKSSIAKQYGVDMSNEVPLFNLKLQLITTALMCTSVVETFLAVSGLIGLCVKFISPLTLSAIYFVLSLSLMPSFTGMMSQNWLIGLLGCSLMVVTVVVLGPIQVPFCIYSRNNGWTKKKIPIFSIIPIIFSLIVMWILCAILTFSGAFPNDPNHWGYKARVDVKMNAVVHSNIFKIPYPLMWGPPKFSVGLVIAMGFSVLISIAESVGDYMATANIIEAPPPPTFAINRGILMEGIGLFLSGLLGSSVGPTSYSDNIGVIKITRVGHRSVVQVTALLMLICGVFPIIGSFIISIPDPIIAGIIIIVLLLIMGVGLNYLQQVNVTSTRNCLVFSLSVGFGLFIPFWFANHPDFIKTGNSMADDIIKIFLNVNLFITFVLSIILDNILPGSYRKTPIETPLTSDNSTINEDTQTNDLYYRYKCYDTLFLRLLALKVPAIQKLPIFPRYSKTKVPENAMDINLCCKKSKRESTNNEDFEFDSDFEDNEEVQEIDVNQKF